MNKNFILLSCVNTQVSLVGIDVGKNAGFWYCPSNILRSCSACYAFNSLYISTDNHLTCINENEIKNFIIPGKYDNYAHSVKKIDESQIALVDTGNSILHFFDGNKFTLNLSPLEEWDSIPIDAIHLNDFLPWKNGFLASSFSYQPFTAWKKSSLKWQQIGFGCIYYLTRFQKKTVSRIVAAGLECPHTLVEFQGSIYCCASSVGDWVQFSETPQGLLYEKKRTHITDTHFLRGALRWEQGWILGGSSRRHTDDTPGMMLFYLSDSGSIDILWEGGAGEIYDILPWNENIMTKVCKKIEKVQYDFDVSGEYPSPCILPDEYRKG